METRPKLIWVSLTLEKDIRERRILDSLEGCHQAVLASVESAREFAFTAGDMVVINSSGAHAEAACLIEHLYATAPGIRILVRCKLSERPLDLICRFASLGVLDAEEGPELTRARLARAASDRRPSVSHHESIPDWRKSLVGRSHAIQKVAELIRLVGPRRCTVLITGETGTGKERVARAIHEAGPRAAGPFVAVNCSAIPAALLESELFGHTRGAFTGATHSRLGRFEQASGGTLFLDEIGELPIDLQAKLLRVLQERELQKLGSSETVRVDARVVAASNCDLPTKVADGTFRADLYYRLNVVPVLVPPLRARESDIRSLAEHFLARFCAEEQLPLKRITPGALGLLERYPWPGNVRQLENAISSAVILSEDRIFLDEDDFSLSRAIEDSESREFTGTVAIPYHGLNFTKIVSDLERNLVSQALRKTGGNKKAAAEMLQLKRTTLSAKIRVLEMTRSVG